PARTQSAVALLRWQPEPLSASVFDARDASNPTLPSSHRVWRNNRAASSRSLQILQRSSESLPCFASRHFQRKPLTPTRWVPQTLTFNSSRPFRHSVFPGGPTQLVKPRRVRLTHVRAEYIGRRPDIFAHTDL